MSRLALAWRDLRIVGRALWLNLALYLGLLLAVGGLMRIVGCYPQASLLDLVVATFQMSHLEGWVQPGDGVLPAILTFLVPGLTVVILGEGVLRVATVFVYRRQHREEWALLLAKTFSGHTVICGVGELGRAVFQRLIATQPDAAVVLVDTRAGIIAEMDRTGPNVCEIQADMTSRETLQAAGCAAAKLIILASGNDAVNLEAGFKALQLNPQAEIWIRLYRSGLASLMDCAAQPNVHFFSPYEQAAQALMLHIGQGDPAAQQG